jgi:Protein of unknown function (DUF559)
VLQGSSVRRLFSGVYVPADFAVTDPVRLAAALAVLPPDALISGVTALQFRGVQVGPFEPLHFVTRHPHQVRRPGIQVTRVQHLPVASGRFVEMPYAFASAALDLDLVDLAAAGDWLVRLDLTSASELTTFAATFAGRHRARVRRAAALVCERVDSPRETRLRLCLVLAGLPQPTCNVVLGDAEFPIGRVDLAYLRWKVIIEYEGDQHRTDRRQWNIDINRQEEFTAVGWTVIRVTAEAMRRPRSVVRRVLAALRAAGLVVSDPRFSAEWVRLFETSAR